MGACQANGKINATVPSKSSQKPGQLDPSSLADPGVSPVAPYGTPQYWTHSGWMRNAFIYCLECLALMHQLSSNKGDIKD